MAEYPKYVGGGYFELSDGRRVQGIKVAKEAQLRLNVPVSSLSCAGCGSPKIYRLLPHKLHCRDCGYQFYLDELATVA
jgi:hypothetical protein